MNNCPICHETDRFTQGKPLYGKTICTRCHNRFTNRRQFAYIIDSILFRLFTRLVGGAILTFVFASMSTVPSQLEGRLGSLLLVGIPFGLVFALKDGTGGKSIGKLFCGVEVRDETTYKPIGFVQSFKRNVCMLIPFAVLVIAFQMGKGKRCGDTWAGTRVVWSKYRDNPVFTGAPLPEDGDVGFDDAGAQQDYLESDNPFQPPTS